jgi:hypothetical protein
LVGGREMRSGCGGSLNDAEDCAESVGNRVGLCANWGLLEDIAEKRRLESGVGWGKYVASIGQLGSGGVGWGRYGCWKIYFFWQLSGMWENVSNHHHLRHIASTFSQRVCSRLCSACYQR